MKKILFAASEAVPFIKTGGLADVVGSLPKELNTHDDCEASVVLPLYRVIPMQYKEQMDYITNFQVNIAGKSVYAGVFELHMDNVTWYFIDNEYYFSGDRIYEDGKWDLEKFAYFDKAVLTMCFVLGYRPDIIHCHDWQTGLIPVYLRNEYQTPEYYGDFFNGVKSIMTIHNLKFQGRWSVRQMQEITGRDDYFFTPDKMESYKEGNYLKGGLVYADWITTVSSVYADEIKTSYFGEGLDGLLRARSNNLSGIVNGIDYDEYNPHTDPFIPFNYKDTAFIRAKEGNKMDLQDELGLEVDRHKFMIGMISRLTEQKGFDLVNYIMDELVQDKNIQVVILGTGDQRFEDSFRYFENRYKGQVSSSIMYDNRRSHRIYAASDAFLMPSSFEPCGLSQLMALRYGSLPIVRETGGLKETVEPYNEYDQTGTGFSFRNYDAGEMLNTIKYAVWVFRDCRPEWNAMVKRAMQKDFSWGVSASKYNDLYNYLLGWY